MTRERVGVGVTSSEMGLMTVVRRGRVGKGELLVLRESRHGTCCCSRMLMTLSMTVETSTSMKAWMTS